MWRRLSLLGLKRVGLKRSSDQPASGPVGLADPGLTSYAINRRALAAGAAVFLVGAAVLLSSLALVERRFQASLQGDQREALLESARDWGELLGDGEELLRLLRRDPRLQVALATDGAAAEAAAARVMVQALRSDHHAAAISLIGNNGRERVSLERGFQSAVSSVGTLRDQSQHAPIKDALRLPADGLYLSPLDHHLRQGGRASSHHVILRLAMPVPAPSGMARVGLVMVSVDMDPLLTLLQERARTLGSGLGQVLVLDQQGALLHSPSEELARPTASPCAASLRCSNPALWSRLTHGGPSGQLLDRSGLWSWQLVDGRTALGAGVPVTPRRWWLLSHLPAAALQPPLGYGHTAFVTIRTTALLVLGGLSLLVVWLRRRELKILCAFLREHKAYALLAQNASDVVLALQRGRIPWVSASVSRYSASPPQHWLQQRALAFVHPDQRHSVLVAIAGLGLDESISLRLQVALAAGRYDWIQLQARCLAPEADPAAAPIITASFHLINEQIRHEAEITYLAEHDELTGLLNRRAILKMLRACLSPDEQRDPRLALLFVDLDAFKAINDTYGHVDGDLVLRQTAQRIRQCLRQGDRVGRLGGDELPAVLPNSHALEDVMTIARKLHKACGHPVRREGVAIHTSVSVGVVLARPGESVEALLDRADRALYRAKSLGCNRVTLLGSDDQRPAQLGRPYLRVLP